MADITLTGNLGSDSELTYTPNGKAKLEFSVGDTPRRLNKQTNQWEDAGETTWWRVTEWEAKAEALADVLLKGTKVLVIGTAGVRTYDKKDGSKGFSAEVKPRTIATIPRGNQAPQGIGQPQQSQQPWGGQQQPTQQQSGQGWGNGATNEPPF